VIQSSIPNRRLISRGISIAEAERKQRGCLGIYSDGEPVPRSLIAQRVKIPPVLFTRIGVEANSGRVSLVRGNLKSLRRSLARSKSEPD
jgi:hypothetical protein